MRRSLSLSVVCMCVCVCGGGTDKRAVEHLDAGDSSAHTRYKPN